MNFQEKGSIPRHVNGTTAANTVEQWRWEGGIGNRIWFENLGTEDIMLSFDQASADAGIGVAVGGGDHVELPAEMVDFFTKSADTTEFQAVVFLRRG